MPELADEKSPKTTDQDDRCVTNPGRAKPVVFLSFVQNDLQRTQPHSQQAEANAVELAGMGVLDIRRIFHVAGNHEHSKDADRNIDVESPAPGISIGGPATRSGTTHGRPDTATSKDCH